MLEVKDLVKIYKPKKGEPVRALDGVSLRFPQTGMVFILGKSGSGKSTLLNVCGGLDAPDGGEIVVKGRSSKHFSAADFDGYRNTLAGFVFQEYNILEEFTVEENVALALELQGKGGSRERVRDILAQVELEGFEKRRPATLSGGQKQRVAIARALVKDPAIIFADEPTGALDSDTGRQVLDLLHKLSRGKLVVVVSHDREFAEAYADRIIELKDGKVISDRCRQADGSFAAADEEGTAAEGIFSAANDAGSAAEGIFSAADEEGTAAEGIFSAADEEGTAAEVISAAAGTSSKTAQGTGTAAPVGSDPSPSKAAAENTKSPLPSRATPAAGSPYAAAGAFSKTTQGAAENGFIRSKLPLPHAVRIGAGSMRAKPLRLAFTILLACIAFALFGMFSTLTFYDPAATAARTYLDADYQTLRLENNYRCTELTFIGTELTDSYERSRNTGFSPQEIEALRAEYGAGTAVYNFTDGEWADESFGIRNAGSTGLSSLYTTELNGFAELDEDAAAYWQQYLLTDTDLSSLGESDALVTAYTFAALQEAGLEDEAGEPVALEKYDDIVGKTLAITAGGGGEISVTVRGVLDIAPPQEFSERLDAAPAAERAAVLEQLREELSYGLYGSLFVSADFYGAHRGDLTPSHLSSNNGNYFYYPLGDPLEIEAGGETIGGTQEICSLPVPYGDTPAELSFFDGRTQAQLAEGEVVVNYSDFSSMIQKMREAEIAAIAASSGEEAAEEARLAFKREDSILYTGEYFVYEYDENGEEISSQRRIALEEEVRAAVENVYALMEKYEGTEYALDTQITLRSRSGTALGCYTLVGFTYGETAGGFPTMYMNEAECLPIVNAIGSRNLASSIEETAYVRPADVRYHAFVLPAPQSEAVMRALCSGAGQVNADDTFFTISTPAEHDLQSIDNFIDMFGQVFLWIGVVMAVFSMLLLFNFISASIAYKKREIGILRAIGARSADVFKIFYAESAIIAAACYLLAVIVCFAVCAALNALLAAEIGVSAFVLGPLSWLVMLGIAALTSFAATYLPVRAAARKKPVESIRAL